LRPTNWQLTESGLAASSAASGELASGQVGKWALFQHGRVGAAAERGVPKAASENRGSDDRSQCVAASALFGRCTVFKRRALALCFSIGLCVRETVCGRTVQGSLQASNTGTCFPLPLPSGQLRDHRRQ